jgi:hypothetical protein
MKQSVKERDLDKPYYDQHCARMLKTVLFAVDDAGEEKVR